MAGLVGAAGLNGAGGGAGAGALLIFQGRSGQGDMGGGHPALFKKMPKVMASR